MARTSSNEVMVTKVVRGFELGETLALSAERLIKAVDKSEKSVRELARELYTIQSNKLLDGTEFNGVGEFFETMTGLSASSASQYLRTFKAFKNYNDEKWCGYSALVPFSMLTEIAKLYGIVKHTETIIDDGKTIEQTGNTAECGNGLLKAFCKIVSEYQDVPEFDLTSDKTTDTSAKQILLYISKEWTCRQVREAIEESNIVCTFEKEKEKKKANKRDNKAGKDNTKTDNTKTDENETDENETDNVDERNYNKLLEIEKLVQEFKSSSYKQLTKPKFIERFYEIYNA